MTDGATLIGEVEEATGWPMMAGKYPADNNDVDHASGGRMTPESAARDPCRPSQTLNSQNRAENRDG